MIYGKYYIGNGGPLQSGGPGTCAEFAAVNQALYASDALTKLLG